MIEVESESTAIIQVSQPYVNKAVILRHKTAKSFEFSAKETKKVGIFFARNSKFSTVELTFKRRNIFHHNKFKALLRFPHEGISEILILCRFQRTQNRFLICKKSISAKRLYKIS